MESLRVGRDVALIVLLAVGPEAGDTDGEDDELDEGE
jgi:hypothetical protein